MIRLIIQSPLARANYHALGYSEIPIGKRLLLLVLGGRLDTKQQWCEYSNYPEQPESSWLLDTPLPKLSSDEQNRFGSVLHL